MTKIGKDREGKFHPLKGGPSARAKRAVAKEADTLTDDLESIGIDGDFHIRHPNRNAGKKDDRSNKKNTIAAARSSTQVSASPAVEGDELFEMNVTQLKSLSEVSGSDFISLYMPTHSSGAAANERADFMLFKNSTQRVASELKSRGKHDEYIQKILAPVYSLLTNGEFWTRMSSGLAVFIAEEFFRFYKMPMAPTESVSVGNTFNLRPLVPIITSSEYFYILTISKKQCSFYKADAFTIQLISVPELPNGIDDVVHFEEKDDQKLFRTGSSGAGGGANYHGIGAGKPDDKENIRMYLDEVDETLWKERLNRENKPLVIAGVEYILPLFKEITKYNNLWPQVLTGNFENADLATLHSRALEVVRPHFDQALNTALEMYGNRSATELTSSVIADVVPAAYYGRVDTLFVLKDSSLWGTFNKDTSELVVEDTPAKDDMSLVDQVILQTLLNGGAVYEVNEDLMPEKNTPLAARMRY